jgi:hypothetical protein
LIFADFNIKMYQDIISFIFTLAFISIAWNIVWKWKLRHILFIKKLFGLREEQSKTNENEKTSDIINSCDTVKSSNEKSIK